MKSSYSTSMLPRKLRGKKSSRVEKAVVASIAKVRPKATPSDGIAAYVMEQNSAKVKRKRNRRGTSTKTRTSCPVLDFSQYPVTGNSLTVGVEKMIRDNQFYRECSDAKIADFNPEILIDLTKPSQIIKKDGKWIELQQSEYAALVKAWELQVQAFKAHVDKPKPLVRGVGQGERLGTMTRPLSNPANGKMLKMEFGTEPTIVADVEGLVAFISDPKFKQAGSWKRELPLKLAMWLICQQEGLDAFELYGVTDKQAQEMIQKYRETAY